METTGTKNIAMVDTNLAIKRIPVGSEGDIMTHGANAQTAPLWKSVANAGIPYTTGASWDYSENNSVLKLKLTKGAGDPVYSSALPMASGAQVGMVSMTTQSFSGTKTLSGDWKVIGTQSWLGDPAETSASSKYDHIFRKGSGAALLDYSSGLKSSGAWIGLYEWETATAAENDSYVTPEADATVDKGSWLSRIVHGASSMDFFHKTGLFKFGGNILPTGTNRTLGDANSHWSEVFADTLKGALDIGLLDRGAGTGKYIVWKEGEGATPGKFETTDDLGIGFDGPTKDNVFLRSTPAGAGYVAVWELIPDWLAKTDGGWIKGPLSTNSLENKGLYYGIDHLTYSDDYMELNTRIPATAQGDGVVSYVVKVDGFYTQNPDITIQFDVFIKTDSSGLKSLKYTNHGHKAPDKIRYNVVSGEVVLFFNFLDDETDEKFLRFSLLAPVVQKNGGGTLGNSDFDKSGWSDFPSYLINGQWGKAGKTSDSGYTGWTEAPEVVITTPPAPHEHTFVTNALQAQRLAAGRLLGIGGAVVAPAQEFNGENDLILNVTHINADYLAGMVPIEALPVGATEDEVAAGNHTHTAFTNDITITTLNGSLGANEYGLIGADDDGKLKRLANEYVRPRRVVFLKEADTGDSAGNAKVLPHRAGTDTTYLIDIQSVNKTRYVKLPEYTNYKSGDTLEFVMLTSSNDYSITKLDIRKNAMQAEMYKTSSDYPIANADVTTGVVVKIHIIADGSPPAHKAIVTRHSII